MIALSIHRITKIELRPISSFSASEAGLAFYSRKLVAHTDAGDPVEITLFSETIESLDLPRPDGPVIDL